MNRAEVGQLTALLMAISLSQSAQGADVPTFPPAFVEVDANLTRWEVRGGVLGSTWGPEAKEIYVNGEIIAPKFYRARD